MFSYDLKGKNKYYTLYSHLREDILRGRLKSGDRLPSKRALAEELSVSVVTVQLAYEQLLAEGYIRSKERSGYFVEEVSGEFRVRDERAPEVLLKPAQKYDIDLVKGSCPPDMFPFSVWARLMRGVLSDSGEHLLERPSPDGDLSLKRAISAYLYRARGIDADPRYIVIGAGAEHLYGVIVQLLGRDKVFAVENPGYGKISGTYALHGARVVPVEVKDTGISLNEVEKSGADAVHVSPSHQFPTGAVTPASERSRLIAWANGGDRYVIEDDYDSEFRLAGKPLQSTYSLCPDRVIYMNTFSKTLAPSMRMGYMVLPSALYEKYMRVFGGSAGMVPLFEQKALAAMLDGGYFERHIQRLKNYYRGVRQKLLEKLKSIPFPCEVKDTGSGLHIIAVFPTAPSDGAIKSRAAKTGVNLRCLSDYLLAPVEGVEKHAVINYSGVTPEQLDKFKV